MKLEIARLTTVAEKRTRTALDTIDITESRIGTWKPPPFQRPLKVNAKMQALAQVISSDGIIPGVITLGVLDGDLYLLDGQHRIEGFRMAGIPVAYADVRFVYCTDMGQMGEEFVNLNSRIVSFRPDDILRGLEGSYEPLRFIRSTCRFVGYDMVRRNDRSPILSMSMVLRTWRGSQSEVPATTGGSAHNLGVQLTHDDAEQLCHFLDVCYKAWGRDSQYSKLWGSLNLMLCAWLYRRTVITQHSSKTPKLSRELFGKCLMSLSADGALLDWLVGRNLGERDRSPAYARIKRIFAARLATELGKSVKMPAPAWSTGD